MRRMLCLFASLILLLSVEAMAEVYKTVDKNGRVTYTDVPPADTNAKPIELKSINSLPTPPPVVSDPGPAPAQAAVEYRVDIIAPENGKTLMPHERSVTVSLGVNPGLQNGDRFAYKLDGNTIQTSSEMSYTIVEPPRGEHVLTVAVVSSEGEILAQSNAVTLLVMRPLVKQPTAPVPKK